MEKTKIIESVQEETAVLEIMKDHIEIQIESENYSFDSDLDQDNEELVEIEENKQMEETNTIKNESTDQYPFIKLVRETVKENKIVYSKVADDAKIIIDIILKCNFYRIADFQKALDTIYFNSEVGFTEKVKKIISCYSYLYSFIFPYKDHKNYKIKSLPNGCGEFFKFLYAVYEQYNESKLTPEIKNRFTNFSDFIDIIVGVSKLNLALELEEKNRKSRYLKFLKKYNEFKLICGRIWEVYCCKCKSKR
jgi:hypothetical protein